MINLSVRLAIIGAASLLLSGCAFEPTYVHPQFHAMAPYTVAVMPPANETVAVAGANLLQYLVGQELPAHGFQVRDVNQTIAHLNSKGIHDGAQLGTWLNGHWQFPPAPSCERLCNDLGVDGLMVGVVETYDYIELVYARTRIVQCKWMLVDRTGTTLWAAQGRGQTASGESKSKRALKDAAANVAIKAVEDAQGIPLYEEAVQSVRNCLASLPRR